MEGKEVIITYDTLFDLSRRERFRKELQPLDGSFLVDVVKYLGEKQSILKSQECKDSIFSSTEAEKTRVQIANAKKILKDLYERREAKILQFALFHSRNSSKSFDSSPMLPEEIELFNDVEKILTRYREDVLHKLLSGKGAECFKMPDKPKALKTEERTEEQESSVRLKCAVPEFVGPDMKTYGPFNDGELVELPGAITEMLIKNGHAVVEGQNENSKNDA